MSIAWYWPDWDPNPLPDRCGDDLMEDDWQEGFRCTLPPGHNGPHRDTSDWDGDNVSTSSAGRKYRWVYEWRYVDDSGDA